jgi:hypothetical protein
VASLPPRPSDDQPPDGPDPEAIGTDLDAAVTGIDTRLAQWCAASGKHPDRKQAEALNARLHWVFDRYRVRVSLPAPGRGKQEGDGRRYTDAEFLQLFLEGLDTSCRATGTQRPHFHTVRRHVGLKTTAFYEYVERVTGHRWADWQANYAELREMQGG